MLMSRWTEAARLFRLALEEIQNYFYENKWKEMCLYGPWFSSNPGEQLQHSNLPLSG